MTVKLNIMVLFYMILLKGPNKNLVACFFNSMVYFVAFVTYKLEMTPAIYVIEFFQNVTTENTERISNMTPKGHSKIIVLTIFGSVLGIVFMAHILLTIIDKRKKITINNLN